MGEFHERTKGEFWSLQRCKRCGEYYHFCTHINTGADTLIPDDHAARIRARYEIGKRFDPINHDTNDYFTDPT